MKVLRAKVLTMDRARPEAEAIAFDEGRVVAVGAAEEVLAAAGPGAAVEELPGRTLVPGFIDPHLHFALGALYRAAVDVGPLAVDSIDTLCERLRAAARDLAPGQWLVANGYDDWRLKERRHPTRDDLDAAVPDRPVALLHYSFHEAVANSKALAAIGVGRHSPDPHAGEIVRGKNGHPTGRLVETAMAPLERMARESLADADSDGFDERILAYERDVLANGVTRLNDPTVPRAIAARYRRLRADGRLRIPVGMMPVSEDGLLSPPWDRLAADGEVTGEGPEDLRVGPLKIFFDGADRCAVCLDARAFLSSVGSTVASAVRRRSFGPFAAARRTSLRVGPDLRFYSGILYHAPDDAHRIVREAVSRGYGVAIHAIGNLAVARALDAIEASRRGHRDVPPPRIEHGMILSPDLVRRAADLGVIVVTQPAFLTLFPEDSIPALPGLKIAPLRSLLDAGARVSGSSDAPVTTPDPLAAMRSAVDRRTAAGELHPEESITATEALAMYTRDAALAAGSLDVAGTLQPGKRADMVVLTTDPTRDLAGARVAQTLLAGEVVHRTP